MRGSRARGVPPARAPRPSSASAACRAARVGIFQALFVTGVFLLVPLSTKAYMSMLRQGAESAESPDAFDHHGERIATGDFNGDGYDDLAVAATDESNGGGNDHGVVVVSYGSARGITHVGADVLGVGDLADFQVHFGRGLAAGDFDGDGVDDLAVGIPGLDFLGTQDIGSVWVYAGVAGSGISPLPYIELFENDVAGAANEAGDQFGYTLAAGDVNLDGYDDLVASAIGEDNGAGIVFYFPGSSGGVTATGAGFAKQSHLGSSNEAGSRFGFALAIGDFFDSLHREIAIGCPMRDVASIVDAGQVYIVRGTSVGPNVTGGQVKNALGLGLGAQSELFGWSLASGRFFETTGRADLAIGAPSHDTTPYTGTGRVVVLEFAGNGEPVDPPIVLTQATAGDAYTSASQFGWSLAAGSMLVPAGSAGHDGYDDLAVGAPNDAIVQPGATEAILWSGVGSVYLFPGSTYGPVDTGGKTLDAFQLNDLWFDFDEHLGRSLAFGAFDDFAIDNLAIGCPDKDYPAFITPDTPKDEAGQVYIYAFWRQPSGRPHRGSIVYDCADRIMYAQRLKQRLTPASTTKALTALIACEAIQNNDVNPLQLYTIPAWAADEVTGSQYGLFPGEQISFQDLLRTMIAVSGNDCAYAIGNILTGQDNVWDYNQDTAWNLEHILADFAAIMNARATQLGMSTSHHFNNPAGRPYGDHWTTAEDMAIFVSQAMQNPMFEQIVSTETWSVQRWIPLNQLIPWLPLPPTPILVDDSVFNGYLDSISDIYSQATGVKGGNNGPSMRTALFAGQLDNGRVKATEFGIPSYGSLYNLGKELMTLVATDCTPWEVYQIDPIPPAPFAPLDLPGVPTDAGLGKLGSAAIGDPNEGDMVLSVVRGRVEAQTTSLALVLERSSECVLAPREAREFGVDALQRHLGLRFQNNGTGLARLQVLVSSPPSTQTVTLGAGGAWDLAPYTPPSGGGAPFAVVVTNLSTESEVVLGVQEWGYGFDLLLGKDRVAPPSWSVGLRRDGVCLADNVSVRLYGMDMTGGSTVNVLLHPPGVPTDVPELALPAVPAPVRLLANRPNPFNPMTRILFEVEAALPVTLRIYDVHGRLVRTLLEGMSYDAGRHFVDWNGSDDTGGRVAAGIYVCRVQAGDHASSRTMTLVK